jgi:hypothetical protein
MCQTVQFSWHGSGGCRRQNVNSSHLSCDPALNLSRNRLATGRPFVVELRDCHRPNALTQESLRILYSPPPEDGSLYVSVINAHTASKAERDELVRAAGTSRKTYRCVVWASRAIGHEDLQELEKMFLSVELQQLTPIRVLHRRPSAVPTPSSRLLLLTSGTSHPTLSLPFAVEKTNGPLDQVFACK